MTTRAQRAFAIRMLAEAQRRLKGADVSAALDPILVAALIDFTEEYGNNENDAREAGRRLLRHEL